MWTNNLLSKLLSVDLWDSQVRARGRLIADAGPLYAAYDADDAEHRRCRRLIESYPGPVLVPILVVTEVAYLLASRVGTETEVRFLGDLAAGDLLPLSPNGWRPQERWHGVARGVGSGCQLTIY